MEREEVMESGQQAAETEHDIEGNHARARGSTGRAFRLRGSRSRRSRASLPVSGDRKDD
jgi:hypothetical protein